MMYFHLYRRNRSQSVPFQVTFRPFYRLIQVTICPLLGHISSPYFPAKPCTVRLPEAESNRKHLYKKQAKQRSVIHSLWLACLLS